MLDQKTTLKRFNCKNPNSLEVQPSKCVFPIEVHNKIIQKLFASTENADPTVETESVLRNNQITRRIIKELAIWRPNQLYPG